MKSKPTALKTGLSAALAKRERTPEQKEVSASAVKPAKRQAQPMLVYLHPEDKQLIKQLSLYLTAQEAERVNPTLVIKAALRYAQQNADFLAAYHDALKNDRRLKEHRKQL